GGAAGRADVADHVAALYVLPWAHREAGEVAIARRVAVAVGDVDDVAVAVGPLGLDHNAVGRGADALSDRGRDVDGVVRPLLARERIGAAAEAVGEDPAYGSDRGRRGEELIAGHELLLEHRKDAVEA